MRSNDSVIEELKTLGAFISEFDGTGISFSLDESDIRLKFFEGCFYHRNRLQYGNITMESGWDPIEETAIPSMLVLYK